MKRILLLASILLSSVALSFAQKRLFMFEKFSVAKVHLKPRGIASYVMNYDMNAGKMYFMQGKDMMELTSVANIDTISWGSRKFIPFGNRFAEVCPLAGATVYVEWKVTDVITGKKGAYGLRTEGNVQNLRLYDFADAGGVSAYTPYDSQSPYQNDIHKRKNENTYYFDLKGKRVSVKKVNQLYKLIPEKKELIKEYIKQNKLDMSSVDEALQIINYILSL